VTQVYGIRYDYVASLVLCSMNEQGWEFKGALSMQRGFRPGCSEKGQFPATSGEGLLVICEGD
jgi:hypothetical protein